MHRKMVNGDGAISEGSTSGKYNTSRRNRKDISVQFAPSTSGGLPGGDMKLGRINEEERSGLPRLAITAPDVADTQEVNEGPPQDENNHKYVGLVNQAMTCYLNSLVQSLYMTPEFRNAIYKWEYKSTKGASGASSIPCQIQKLFLLLQTTELDSLETKDLTASFGWNSNEAYDQHDVQELCRLMFDALEQKWKGSQNEKLIQQLYRGSIQDFVKCLSCGKENVRPDFFLDLPLAVKPFGVVQAFKSVEEALGAFVAPELLNGSNQYHCENCKSKQDAHKGLRITSFPYLLTIQLKRFDFDYNTMHRIKLNDRVTFPDVLNLNPFVHSDKPNEEEDNNMNEESSVHVGERIDQANVDRLLKQGEYVYELFSVMVHQGSAAGGHYFAYIKNMDQDRWYCFNDTRVEAASPSDVERSFGGGNGGWSSSNTNAYMLLYRKIDRKHNQLFTRSCDLPAHITQLQNVWKNQEEEKERQRQYEASLVNVTVRFNMPCQHAYMSQENFSFQIPRTETLGEIHTRAMVHFSEKAKKVGMSLVKSQSRLILADGSRMYDSYVSKACFSKKIDSILNPASTYKDLYFLLDFKIGSSHFLTMTPNNSNSYQSSRTVAVHLVDIEKRIVRPSVHINLLVNHRKVINAKTVIGNVFMDDQRHCVASRLVLQKNELPYAQFVQFESPTIDLFDQLKEVYAAVPVLYYDGGFRGESAVTEQDRKQKLDQSVMFEILDRKKFAMSAKITLPSEDEIHKAKSTCRAYAGPSWKELEATAQPSSSSKAEATKPAEVQSTSSSSPAGFVSDMVGSLSPSNSLNEDIMNNLNEDRMDNLGDLVDGSPCQNTPQVSPVVSDDDLSPQSSSKRGPILPDFSTFAEGAFLRNPPQEQEQNWKAAVNTGCFDLNDLGDYSKKILVLNSDENVRYLDVDSRTTLAEFKSWISETIKVDKSMFVLNKHLNDNVNDNGYEITARDAEIFSAACNCSRLSVALRPQLKDDEKLIPIILFDMEEYNKDNWKNMFSIPASSSTLVGDILLQCQRLYQDVCGTKIDYQQIRLRDMQSGSVKVLRPQDALMKRTGWYNPIHMQIVTDPTLIGKQGIPIFVRRFRPSTAEVSGTHEVVVQVKEDQNDLLALREAVAQASGIPLERLEVTEIPTSFWDTGKWPYTKSRLEMLDGSVKFVKEPSSTYMANGLERIGCKVIYYKDSDEKSKVLTEEERKQITIKDNSVHSNNAASRRKERPLRIQMSSISEP